MAGRLDAIVADSSKKLRCAVSRFPTHFCSKKVLGADRHSLARGVAYKEGASITNHVSVVVSSFGKTTTVFL